jgi:hypothetical protein
MDRAFFRPAASAFGVGAVVQGVLARLRGEVQDLERKPDPDEDEYKDGGMDKEVEISAAQKVSRDAPIRGCLNLKPHGEHNLVA